MSAGVAIDVRPFVAHEAEAQIVRGSSGVPELRSLPGVKAQARWLSGLARILGKSDQVPVTVRIERAKVRDTRSQAFSAYWWAAVLPVLLDGLRQIAMEAGGTCPFSDAESLHAALLARHLPEIAPEQFVEFHGLRQRPTHTTLSTAQMFRLTEATCAWAASLGIYIAPPTREGSAA